MAVTTRPHGGGAADRPERLQARRSRRSRAIAVALIVALSTAVLTVITTPAAQSATATGGSGRFLTTINWFSWGSNGARLANNTTRTNTITVGGQEMAITCTISDLQGSGGLASYRPGEWQGDGFDEMYNIGGTGNSNQLVVGIRNGASGGNANFDLDCSATFDGDPIELAGMVMADAEQSSGPEYVGATAPAGATWRIIDRYRSASCTSSTYGFRQGSRLDLRTGTAGDSCPAGPTAVAFLEDATSLDDVTVRGNGLSAIAVGVAITLDFGDAPASYDVAGAVSQFRYTGGTIPESTGTWNVTTNRGTDLFGAGFSLASPAAPLVRLGSNTDTERSQTFSATASGDDGAGEPFWGGPDDETLGIPARNAVFPGDAFSLPIACSGRSQLAGWIDWDRNGTFDTAERSAVANCTAGGRLTWTVPESAPADGASYASFIRIRTGKNAALSPTGFTPDGEVEDHAFTFTTVLPDAADDAVGAPVGTPVTVAVLDNDIAGTDATIVPGTVVFTSAAATDGGRRLEVPGEGVYVIDRTTGSVTFTPAVDFTGPTTPVEYRAYNNSASAGPGSTAALTVTIGAPSVAVDDTATTVQNTTVRIEPLRNDTAGDDGTGEGRSFDPRTVVFTGADAAVGGKSLTVAGEGNWSIDPATGVVSFDPLPGFTGTATPVSYRVTDAFGNTATADLRVTVTAVTPDAEDDVVSTAFDTPLTVDVIDNDHPGSADAPLDRATLTFTDPAATADGRTLVIAGQGTFRLSATTGEVTFTPVDGFSGAVDAAGYRVLDTNGTPSTAELRVTVAAAETPTANPDTLTTQQNVTASIDPMRNDTSVPAGTFDPASVVLTSPDATQDGKRLVVAGQGVWTIDPMTGVASFDPDPGFVGVTTPVEYRVTGATGTSAVSTLTARVSVVTPTAAADQATTAFRTPVASDVLGNDTAGADSAPLDGTSVILTSADATEGGRRLDVVGQGTYAVSDSGAITFTPDSAFTGSATPVTYRVRDANGTMAESTLSVVVAVPAAASASADTASTLQNITVSTDVLANDIRPDGVSLDPASVVFTSGNATDGGRSLIVANEGTYAIDPTTGVVTFDPLPAFTGIASPVTYRVTDSFGRTSTAPFTVTVRSASPDARNDSAQTPYNQATTVAVLANDVLGASGAPLVPASVILTGPGTTDGGRRLVAPREGVWTVDAGSGSLSFAPDPGFTGPATAVTYRVSDTNSATDTATVEIVVNTPPPPAARPDTATTAQNVNVTVDPLANDASTGEPLPHDTVHFTDAAATDGGRRLVVPGQGSYAIDPVSGLITFDPLPTFSGVASPVAYEIADAFGATASSAITVTVTAVSPTAVDDATRTPYATAVGVDVTANDRPGSSAAPLVRSSVVLVDPAAVDGGRRLVVAGQGTYVVDATTGVVTFTPVAGFAGAADGVRYRITDANGTTATASLIITVDLPAAPSGQPDAVSTPQNVTVSVDPVSNDRGTSLVRASVVLTAPGASADGKTLVVAGQGTWRIDATSGQASFDPEAGFVGVATVDYRIADAFGRFAPSTISVTVTAISPVAGDDAASAPYGDPVTVSVLDNDRAGDASAPLDPTSVVLLGQDASADGRTLTVDGEGAWTVDPQTGAVTFVPETGFAGEATPVDYRVSDANGTTAAASIRVTVTLPNAPLASDDSETTPQNTPVTVAVLDNDETFDGVGFDPGDVAFTSGAATLDSTRLAVSGEGVWTVDAQGRVIFAPDAGFSGPATPVEYRVVDAFGRTVTATVSVQVIAVTPVAVDDDAVGPFQNPVRIDVLANDRAGADSAALDPTSVVFTDDGASADGKTSTVPGQGAWTIDPSSGVVIFDPIDGFSGMVRTAGYRVSDSNGTTADAEIRVTIGATPAAADDRVDTPQNVTITFDPLANDLPGDGGLGTPGRIDPTTLVLTAPEATSNGRRLAIPGEGVYTIDPETGTITFDPEPDFFGSASPVEYVWLDDFAEEAGARVLVSVSPLAPAVVDDSTVTSFGQPAVVDVLRNDEPGGPSAPLVPASVILTDDHASGDGKTLVLDGEGAWTVDLETGVVTFTPEPGFAGAVTPVRYSVADTNGTRATAEISVTVRTPAEPVSLDDDATTAQNVSVTVDVLDNDTVPPGSALEPSSVRFTADAASDESRTLVVDGEGTWSIDRGTGVVTFDPEPGFTGAASPVAYAVSDVFDQEVTAQIRVTVSVITPTAQADSAASAFGGSAVVRVLDNDAPGAASAALDAGSVRFTDVAATDGGRALSIAGEGTWSIDQDGVVTFRPQAGFTGRATPVEYSVADENGTRAQAAVSVTVGLPAPPAAVSDSVATPQNVTVAFRPLENDTAALGSPIVVASLAFTAVEAADGGRRLVVPGEGVFRIDPDTGVVSFDPNAGFTGVASVEYRVTDAHGQSSTASISVTVGGIVPVARDDEATTGSAQPVVIDVLENDSAGADSAPLDPGSVRFTASAASDDGRSLIVAGEGTWRIDPTSGAITFSPESGFAGVSAVEYSVADSNGTRASAAVAVTVAAAAQPTPSPGPTPVPAPPDGLAGTGADSSILLGIALAALLGGLALVGIRRAGRVRVADRGM